MMLPDSLKRFRQKFQLTQKNVANALGVRESSYQRYEHGKVVPSVNVMIKLSNIYNVSVDYLVGLSDVPTIQRYST